MTQGISVSQLREYLAELQETEGDIPVRFPSMINPDSDEDNTVGVEGIAVIEDPDSGNYLLLCDVLTLDEIS